jgi:hypothetical protein
MSLTFFHLSAQWTGQIFLSLIFVPVKWTDSPDTPNLTFIILDPFSQLNTVWCNATYYSISGNTLMICHYFGHDTYGITNNILQTTDTKNTYWCMNMDISAYLRKHVTPPLEGLIHINTKVLHNILV